MLCYLIFWDNHKIYLSFETLLDLNLFSLLRNLFFGYTLVLCLVGRINQLTVLVIQGRWKEKLIRVGLSYYNYIILYLKLFMISVIIINSLIVKTIYLKDLLINKYIPLTILFLLFKIRSEIWSAIVNYKAINNIWYLRA